MLPFNPPLLNSANPWATTEADLSALFHCPHTGAVTTRTCTLDGFDHDEAIHQHAFFDAAGRMGAKKRALSGAGVSSLNTLGYSPLPLVQYLEFIMRIVSSSPSPDDGVRKKPFIVSVTGSPDDVARCYLLIVNKAWELHHPCYMEINLSCPNIKGKAPPAYDAGALRLYLHALYSLGVTRPVTAEQRALIEQGSIVPVGIKTPPYTYAGQFETLISALLKSGHRELGCPISFITATNTLGSSLIMSPATDTNARRAEDRDGTTASDVKWQPTLSSAAGTGIGGMAGAALHPLALGNVATLRRMLDETAPGTPDGQEDLHFPLKTIEIIGVGGVSDRAGFERMQSAGAACVGVGTALGAGGVGVFKQILGK